MHLGLDVTHKPSEHRAAHKPLECRADYKPLKCRALMGGFCMEILLRGNESKPKDSSRTLQLMHIMTLFSINSKNVIEKNKFKLLINL